MIDHNLKPDVLLTVDIAGQFYQGQIADWRRYARTLAKGRFHQYGQFRGLMSITGFFAWLLRESEASAPTPEDFGMIRLRPSFANQMSIIDELLDAA